jgi:hypothetical protein
VTKENQEMAKGRGNDQVMGRGTPGETEGGRRPTEDGETRVTVDGIDQPDNTIPLVDGHQEHYVEVSIPVGRS